MSRFIDTTCPKCGALVYTTMRQTWRAAQQAQRELDRHLRVHHSGEKAAIRRTG